jgi:Sec-independent protein translocase protein TatA
MVERGSAWESQVRGSSYTPLGARQGFSTVTGLLWGETEMTVHIENAFLRPDDVAVENGPVITSAQELHRLLESLQARGRECLVALGDLTRRGILRSVKATPGRAASVSWIPGQPLPGADLNRELVLKWEWSGDGEALVGNEQVVTGADVAGQLGGASAKLGAGLADIGAFAPDLATSLGSAIGKLRKGINDLRKTLKGLGDLARLPAKTASQLLGAARSVGNLVSDTRSLLSDTTDDFKALGEAAKGAAAAVGLGGLVGPTAAKKAAAKRAAKGVADGVDAAQDAVVAIFDAIAKRKPRTVGVRPGQSLADVARAQLGSADRWPEIAEANGIDGQAVPAATFQLEIPARGK